MSAETTCRFEELDRGVLAVTLRPELNEIPWTDIDHIGSGIVNRIMSRDRPRVLVDLTELSQMGSAMVALVVRIWKAATEKGGRMVVVNRHELVSEVLEISGLAGKWTIVPNRGDALREFHPIGGPVAGFSGNSAADIGLTIATGIFMLIAVLAIADAVARGAVASSMGTAVAYWIGAGCAVIGVVLGIVAASRTLGTIKLAAIILAVISLLVAVAGVVLLFGDSSRVMEDTGVGLTLEKALVAVLDRSRNFIH